jgi:uncharacterized membrane protein
MPGLSIIYSSLILFTATVILIYTIIYNINNKLIERKDITLYKIKTLLISCIISILFTLFITWVSIKVTEKTKE